jgi:hypothetical protein
MMKTDVIGTRIMIFLSQDDRVGHKGLPAALMERAREDGMAGATVWAAIEGFGSSGHFRTNRFPDLADGLPLALELIDLPERIEAFLPVVHELAPGSLVTREEVRITRFTSGLAQGLDDLGPEGSLES